MKWLRAGDAWAIRMTQEAYLWAWDRAGVYLGTVLFASWVVDFGWLIAVMHKGDAMLLWLLLLFGGLFCGHRYVVQDRADYRRMNHYAEYWEGSWLRVGGVVMNVCGVLVNLALADWTHVIMWLVGTPPSYLMCTRLREREPPQELKLATAPMEK